MQWSKNNNKENVLQYIIGPAVSFLAQLFRTSEIFLSVKYSENATKNLVPNLTFLL